MTGPVLLVFCHDTDLPWLRFLRPGFRHVFAAMPVAGGWITLDPLSNRLELAFHPLPDGSDLAGWFRQRGHHVLAARRRPPSSAIPFPLTPLTCVGVVKRLLGLRAPFVLTPWQLYRHLGGDPPIPQPQNREYPSLARLVSSPKPAAAPAAMAANPIATAGPSPSAAPAVAVSAPVDAVTSAEQSLLHRTAGRAGTVLTGWRGVLAPGALAPARKKLLGE